MLRGFVRIVQAEYGAVGLRVRTLASLISRVAPMTKRINSRQKGAAGERELAKFLREHGYDGAYRGQQFQGGKDSPDVVCPGLEMFHFECKRVEAGSPYEWYAQAQRDCGGKVPVVAHRRSRQDWIVVLSLADFLSLLPMKGI